MNLQDVFYLTAILYLLVTGAISLFIFYQISKLISFLKEKKQEGEEMMLNAIKTKYTMQMGLFKIIYKLLGGGEKYG